MVTINGSTTQRHVVITYLYFDMWVTHIVIAVAMVSLIIEWVVPSTIQVCNYLNQELPRSRKDPRNSLKLPVSGFFHSNIASAETLDFRIQST